MEHLAYITLLIESNNEDNFEKSNNSFNNITFNNLCKLLEPSYTIRGFITKTPIHFESNDSQKKKVKLTEEAYQKHIAELNKYDF